MAEQDTRARAQRRRDDRRNKRPFGSQSLSRQNLRDAENELDTLADRPTASYGTMWTTLVEQWQALDYQRESAQTAYTRLIELQKLGRTEDTKALVKAYAEAKQEQGVLENQAIEFLANAEFGPTEIRSFLYDQRAIPGRGILIRPPEALVDTIEERLKTKADSESGDEAVVDDG